MSERQTIQGRCLCGAVDVSATPAKGTMHLCHCDMCRRQSGAGFLSVATVDGSLKSSGPVTVFKSSEWAERAFCGICGSTLWYAVQGTDIASVSAGLFEGAAGHTLDLEYYIDNKPAGYAFAGDHKRLTTKQALAMFAPEEGDAE